MPTYQYSCTECEHFFEQFQNFSDDSLTVCPECGGQLRKVFNAVGVVFKGSGFYRNDSRSTTSSSEAGSSSGSKDSDSSSSGSKDSSSSSSGSKDSGSKDSSSSDTKSSSSSTTSKESSSSGSSSKPS